MSVARANSPTKYVKLLKLHLTLFMQNLLSAWGGIFFKRRSVPSTEVINDRSGDISNFFRILQRHYQQFIDVIKFQITDRREFDRLKACNAEMLTDLERAARFLYLQKISFGGKVVGQTFGIQLGQGGRFNVERLTPVLEAIHKRLSGAIIENLNWPDFIHKYDSEGTLFYCDPPYFGTEEYYGEGLFDRFQYSMMANHLGRIKGHFILSINDEMPIRKTFEKFKIREATLSYTCGKTNLCAAKELIITNF